MVAGAVLQGLQWGPFRVLTDISQWRSLLEIYSSSAMMVNHQAAVPPDKQPRQLKKLSDTRWACRYSAINAICYTFDALLVTLEDISSGSDHSKAVEARGLLHKVKNFKFLLSLIIFDCVLSCTNSL